MARNMANVIDIESLTIDIYNGDIEVYTTEIGRISAFEHLDILVKGEYENR